MWYFVFNIGFSLLLFNLYICLQVLQSKARGPKGCFKEPQMAICGNGVVEEGEECDCGWEEDCLEDCCWPQRTKFLPNQVGNS